MKTGKQVKISSKNQMSLPSAMLQTYNLTRGQKLYIVEIPFGHSEANLFTKLRSQYGKKLHPIDAINLTTGMSTNANYFVCNDTVFDHIKFKTFKLCL